MAREEIPYSAPDAVEADQTGTRTAVNEGDTTVTEPQAEQAAAQDTDAVAEAARKQAEEDAQALHEARESGPGYVGREANPNIGGESFPSFSPAR